MKTLNTRLNTVKYHIDEGVYTVMIIGLGSVGTYLLDYLISSEDDRMRIVVVGRDYAKMQESVNIVRISGLIREQSKSEVIIKDGVDLNDISAIRQVIEEIKPDFIVNSSRAYPGLKYGSISWTNLRAYGIWTPLAIRFTKNIMQACDDASSDAIVINTSYSDAVISWLKSANKAYPDFGSGNLNHLIPRIRYAVSDMLGIRDFWNVDVVFAVGHFHDVVISKEGHSEGVRLPLRIWYSGQEICLKHDEVGERDVYDGEADGQILSVKDILNRCAISMPTDARRNQMNASSDYKIIKTIVDVCQTQTHNSDGFAKRVFIPGAEGELGGYPVMVGYRNGALDSWIDDSFLGMDEMRQACRKSMYLDGVEDVRDGNLYYTDELIDKVKDCFGVVIPKIVGFDDIEDVARLLIEKIIKANC